MADLRVNIAGLDLVNPVLTASGTFGYGIEYQDFIDLSQLGGVIVKGTTLQPREGNPYPRMAETAEQRCRLLLRAYLSADKGHQNQYDCQCIGQ